jgi:hypothetical protein
MKNIARNWKPQFSVAVLQLKHVWWAEAEFILDEMKKRTYPFVYSI